MPDPFIDKDEKNLTLSGARELADTTHEVPFHTLGKGMTQAAPGNHKHAWSELTGDPPDATPLDHTHEWADITNPPGIPAQVDYTTYVSGPHGPLSFYQTVGAVAGVSGVTYFPNALQIVNPYPGIIRVMHSGYCNIQNVNSYSKASLTEFIYPWGVWVNDGQPIEWHNGGEEARFRLTLTKKAGTTSGDYIYSSFQVSAYFTARAGWTSRLGVCANVDNAYDGTVFAQFGFIRTTVLHMANAQTANDAPAWVPA